MHEKVSTISMMLWRSVQNVLETYGWKLLVAAFLFYVGYRRYRKFTEHRRHQRILAGANDPERVAILKRETARVRDKQQQEMQAKFTKRKAKGQKRM
ncbi:hypothetical protein KXD40_006612 [Peronospora effusa]|uniref:Uncharacterized protein n=1 Tax=Peronospora effusa TaxID=542832 RepID=A0A3M6VSJ9_9STRA|nr:hypothetical protein DD238_001698 [Peronospora effusa]RQM16394.1 hypothetical protein DD237_005959 [Peronospora effusa]UIZ24982.1 hypothetical protein KXD40_006612 [Peronospora effusa]